MTPFSLPPNHPRIRRVHSFEELVATRFADGVNAFCWQRELAGDFAAVIAALGPGEGVRVLDENDLLALTATLDASMAITAMLDDLRRLRLLDLDPILNCIHAYPRDDDDALVATDVMSFHVDSAPVEADTWLCTYYGAPSDGIDNDEVIRKIDHPATRAALLEKFGGHDDADFAAYLTECCYDLHFAPLPGAKPYSFGLINLWRIATAHPGCPVPPCVHRAPATVPGAPRLLLIS